MCVARAQGREDVSLRFRARILIAMHLVVFGLPLLVVILNWLWPLPLPLPLGLKITAAALVVVAALYHYWSRLSSGSVFAPEFPRPIVILFNWAFGTILLLTLLQIALDFGALLVALVTWQPVHIPVGARVAVGGDRKSVV